MKQTSLHAAHKAAGATMVDFAGWDMPVSYAGTVGEIAAVRGGAGLFDVSHMGEARVRGAGALAFVQRVTANDAAKLTPGAAQYSLLLNPEGGIIDDIIVYCVAGEEYLIVLNAGCKDKDWAWLAEQSAGDASVTLTDESDDTALIAVQGPAAVALVAGLAGADSPISPDSTSRRRRWTGSRAFCPEPDIRARTALRSSAPGTTPAGSGKRSWTPARSRRDWARATCCVWRRLIRSTATS